MNPQWIRGRVAASICILTVFVLSPTAAGPAAGSGISATTTVGEAVTDTLVAATGSAAIADTSTDCMTDDPEPVAYRTDRVVLSTSMSAAAAAATVHDAFLDLGVTAKITGVETISMSDIVAGVVPIVSVSFDVPAGVAAPITQVARHLRRVYDLVASPDYLLSPSSGPSEFWPNGPPRPAEALPPQRDAAIGAGTSIFVYDTGLASDGESTVPPNVHKLSLEDAETPDSVAPSGVVDLPYAGHTTAIAGVINTVAPGAAVTAIRITESNGVATDVSAARRMADSLHQAYESDTWPDLIVTAFGSPACDGEPGQADAALTPLGLLMIALSVDNNHQALVVASAGNRASQRPFYPAAFPTVIGVGALDLTATGSPWTSHTRSGPPAAFSNSGEWVKAWMPGVDLATNHIKGYRWFPDQEKPLDGLAFVDGTSFAAPMAAALIAEEISALGLSADLAWHELRESGVTCSPAVGSGVALALTSLDDRATTPPPPGSPVEC